MTPASPLPPENCRLFLLVRRGVPLLGALLLVVLAALSPAGRGWFLLGAVALLAEVGPTFKRGKAYLAARTPILRWDGLWARALRPLARWSRLEEAWILSFCAWNNRRVREVFQERKARRALVLLPHCIQMARCKADVLQDLGKCYECGLCSVGELLPLQVQRGWESRITNRSHKAYREARDYRPDLMVAVSCADRLLKGLTKLPEVPSYVIPLELPHGMCVDTGFSVAHLLTAMDCLVEPRDRAAGTDAGSAPAAEDRIVPLHREGIA
jgi:hypothetical protein